MRYVKLILWVLCAVVLCVSLSEAGRFRAAQSGCASCANGVCDTAAVQAALPADTEMVAGNRAGWWWNKPTPPAPVTPPTPAPTPPAPCPCARVVVPGTVTAEVSAEVRHPLARVAAVPIRAATAAVRAGGKAVKAVVGHQRRAERRAARRSD